MCVNMYVLVFGFFKLILKCMTKNLIKTIMLIKYFKRATQK